MSSLQALIARSREPRAVRAPVEAPEQCELCGATVPEEHRHVLERANHALLCACRPCSVLFDHDAAGGGRYRLIPDRRTRVRELRFDDLAWRALRIPVDLAYFVRGESGVTAYYPSPAGPVESLLPLDAWAEIEDENPALRGLQSEVEALLVNRIGATRAAWIVGIDVCYRLVALFRRSWTGMQGGDALWEQTRRFFDDLDVPRRAARL
jgi:hypothetical protein